MTSANNLTALLIGTPTGLLSLLLLIKELKGKKPKQTESPDCIIFEAENIKLSVPKEVARLYNDKPIRDQIEGVVRPLQRQGIDRIVFRQNEIVLQTVDTSEVDYFSLSDDKDNVTEYIIPRQRLQIESLKFKKGKWQLSDGANTHWYLMDDKIFISEIDKGKTFGKYHILVCEVLMTQQLQNDGKLKLDYTVKKVLNHIATVGQQLPLKE